MKQQQVGTIVGSSVHLTGAIRDSSDITIFGGVDGEVISEQKVIIEDSANVKGPITAQDVLVNGTINGTIIARDKIELTSTAVVKGNIETGDLLIHSGATFIGKCTMPNKKETIVSVDADSEIEPEKEDDQTDNDDENEDNEDEELEKEDD